MTVHSLANWLYCPLCQMPLEPQQPLGLVCGTGHSFDVNKRGFVNMLSSANRMIGDSPAMLDARSSFLGAGHFAQIRDALVSAAALARRTRPASMRTDDATHRIIDAGCGTGYYLEGLLQQTKGPVHALAMDISPHAVARAVRSSRQLSLPAESTVDGLVADIWRPLPIRDACADTLFTVFAPRNLDEFHRVLKPHGALHVVVPTERHIHQIRTSGQALDIPSDKAERLEASSAQLFSLIARRPVEYEVVLATSEAAELVGMGPSSHHAAEATDAQQAEAPTVVTVSVDVLTFTPR